MNNNIKLKLIKKIFPNNDMNINIDELKFDDVGLYSISLPKDADIISEFIKNNIINNNIINNNIISNITILDGTAGIGGNIISFAKYFKSVIGFELDENRFNILNNNIKVYNLTNISTYNLNSLDNLLMADIYFFDPPWGGPNYKKYKNLTFKFNDIDLDQIVIKIKKINKDSYIAFKLPINFNLSIFDKFDYKILNLKKMLIILILPNIE
ncbi:putative RNA methylase [Chlorella virus XW01]|nr:putative RNA methylase [Chlorella virus XW01]